MSTFKGMPLNNNTMKQTDPRLSINDSSCCSIFNKSYASDSVPQTVECNDKDVEHHQCKSSCCLPPIPEGLEPLKHQLAGHKFGAKDNADHYGMLDCKDGTILKPVMLLSRKGEREKYFYELVNGISSVNSYFTQDLYEVETIRKLKKFTPMFKGLVALPVHPNVLYIKMVDVTDGFVKPHSIDVKIGAKAWDPIATEEKIKRQKARCPYLDTICFQVLGAKYFDAQTGDAVVKRDLRKYSPYDLLHSGFYEIFRGIRDGVARSTILQYIIEDLKGIADWFGSQSHLSFHGSSVLIVFEGDELLLDSYVSKRTSRLSANILQVKMIDFMHVWQRTTRDSNYLEGIRSLTGYLESLIHLFKESEGCR